MKISDRLSIVSDKVILFLLFLIVFILVYTSYEFTPLKLPLHSHHIGLGSNNIILAISSLFNHGNYNTLTAHHYVPILYHHHDE